LKLQRLEVLSSSEIQDIHNATMNILENCGVRVPDEALLLLLRSKGLAVDLEKRIVRFNRASIEDALSNIPSQFEIYDREGFPAFILGDGEPRMAAGHNAIFWVDSTTGETRPSTIADVAFFSRLCEHLADIDMIGIPVMPQDVPQANASLLYGVRAVIQNSKKPIFFSTDNRRVNHAVIKMLEAAFQGDFQNQVYGISQLSPTSPLSWEPGVLEAILDTLQTAVPLAILPEPNAGVSAPYTLAGLLTVNNAECLSGLAMIQMLKPGAKVLYANSWTTTDMRSGAALVGSVETSICRIAGAQLARFYHVPSHTTAPNSDNHAHDEQNSWEKTYSAFCSLAAGNDLVVNCGMFATGLTCSNEQLLMDAEITAMARRITTGIRVDAETIASDLIQQTGPRGSYLVADHTLNWLHSQEYLKTHLAVRGSRASWEAQGSPDTYRLAQEQACKSANLPGSSLDARRTAQLDEIISAFN
jgi:trimethylamine---corrinoid protein Co-methyltransferase